jgi:hypothetical protein
MVNEIAKKEKTLIRSPESQRFWVSNGSVLSDLNDLKKALEEMDDDTFYHHVNQDKNDFSLWVREVLKESKLSSAFKKIKTKKSMLQKIKVYLS